MKPEHIIGVVALQRECFPPPFTQELLWQTKHLAHHLVVFPQGQFVAFVEQTLVGSSSNVRLSSAHYERHLNWDATVGGPFLRSHDPCGQLLFGVDISVSPAWRGQGIARALYKARFDFVRRENLDIYATACRMPGFAQSAFDDPGAYAEAVVMGDLSDRTLTPLLRIGLTYRGVICDHMEDAESGNAAAILEWTP